MDRSQISAFTLLICLFMFLAVMGLQSTRACVIMPDREYIALKEQGKDVPVGVVSETQNMVTLIGSFGLIGLSMFLAIYVTTSIIRLRFLSN
jgi:hypothetical protein